jgi:hypothetical protein
MRSPFSGVFRAALASLPILVLLGSNVQAQEFEEIAVEGSMLGYSAAAGPAT